MIYDDRYKELGIMVKRFSKGIYYDPNINTYGRNLVMAMGGIPVNKTEAGNPNDSSWVEEGVEGEFITWISPFVGRNQLQDVYVELGNEVATGIVYCSPCLIANVPAAVDRV